MYQIFAASDATGTTSERVLRAALTQFDPSLITVTRSGGIRSAENISGLVHEAALKQGFIVHTFVSEELRGSQHHCSSSFFAGYYSLVFKLVDVFVGVLSPHVNNLFLENRLSVGDVGKGPEGSRGEKRTYRQPSNLRRVFSLQLQNKPFVLQLHNLQGSVTAHILLRQLPRSLPDPPFRPSPKDGPQRLQV